MRVYVAAKFEDQERVLDIMAILRHAGHTITYDWTRKEQISKEQATLDAQGVLTAEALILVAEQPYAYCGALVELGLALGRGIPIYVLGTVLDAKCIFMLLPEIYHVSSVQQMLTLLA